MLYIKNITEGAHATISLHRSKYKFLIVKHFHLEKMKTIDSLNISLLSHVKAECMLSKLLIHERVLKCIDSKATLKNAYLITDFCEMGDLFELTSKCNNFISLPIVHDICMDIGSALQFIHEKGIIHKDLKLENILVSSWCNQDRLSYKLCDFGLSCLDMSIKYNHPFEDFEIENEEYKNEIETLKKRYNSISGTYAYMSPEMVNFKNKEFTYSTLTDVWGFGVCIFNLLRCLDEKVTGRFKYFFLEDYTKGMEHFFSNLENANEKIIQMINNIYVIKSTDYQRLLPKMLDVNQNTRISISKFNREITLENVFFKKI